MELHKKFTVTGESFLEIQIQERLANEDKERETLLIEELVNNPNFAQKTIFIVKTVHSCEVFINHHVENIFIPLEFAIVAFRLNEGYLEDFSTLIDTVSYPLGYAYSVKETMKFTGLPKPGSNHFSPEDKKYTKILQNIKLFIERNNHCDVRKSETFIFGMDCDLKPCVSSFKWLIDHVEDIEFQNEFSNFFFYKLNILPLPKLVMSLGKKFSQINLNFKILSYKPAAVSLFRESNEYEYLKELACKYHQREEISRKVRQCSRNIVIREMFILIETFIHQFTSSTKRHNCKDLLEERILQLDLNAKLDFVDSF